MLWSKFLNITYRWSVKTWSNKEYHVLIFELYDIAVICVNQEEKNSISNEVTEENV